MDSLRIPSRFLVAAGFVSENTKIITGLGAHANKIDVGPPYYGIDLLGLTMDNRYYLYSTEMNSGGLYDVSGNCYDFRAISNSKLLHEYHDRLFRYLEKRGIYIKQTPT